MVGLKKVDRKSDFFPEKEEKLLSGDRDQEDDEPSWFSLILHSGG